MESGSGRIKAKLPANIVEQPRQPGRRVRRGLAHDDDEADHGQASAGSK